MKEKTALKELHEWIGFKRAILTIELLDEKIKELFPKEKAQIKDAYIVASTLTSEKYENSEDYYEKTFES